MEFEAQHYISFPSLINVAYIRPVAFEEYKYEHKWYFQQKYWTSEKQTIFYIPNMFLGNLVRDIKSCEWLETKDDAKNISSSREHRTLLSCVGDDILPVNHEDIDIILKYFEYWFVSNLTFKHHLIGTRIFPIPIGLDFHTKVRLHSFPVHKQEHILQQMVYWRKYHMIYNTGVVADFHLNRTHSYRQKVFNVLQFNENITFIHKRVSRNRLWDLYLKHQFVCCPRGFGIDTHRIWEVLALNRYPIVIDSSLNPLYEQYPVVIIRDWNEITKENLVWWAQELKKRQLTYNDTKLTLDYWKSVIQNPKLMDKKVLALYSWQL